KDFNLRPQKVTNKNGSVAISGDLKTAIIIGKVVMEDRRLPSPDLEKTVADTRKIAEDIMNCY
ncbi:MAG: hypothetical protein KJN80_06080, partial [Deltaproteobacteria bacterium]|nr:hypothetical protein [Deltaproteobacteria bacterium]